MEYTYKIEKFNAEFKIARILYVPINEDLLDRRLNLFIPSDLLEDEAGLRALIQSAAPVSEWRSEIQSAARNPIAVITALAIPTTSNTTPIKPDFDEDTERINYGATTYDSATDEETYDTRSMTDPEIDAQRLKRAIEIKFAGQAYMFNDFGSDSMLLVLQLLQVQPANAVGLALRTWMKDVRSAIRNRYSKIKSGTIAYTEAAKNFSNFPQPHTYEELLAELGA